MFDLTCVTPFFCQPHHNSHTHTPNSETFGPMVDLPHLHAPPWQEQSREGHSASVLPVSHARSHINQKGCGGSQLTSQSLGASCVWDAPCWPACPWSHTVIVPFGLVNSEAATADQIQGHIRLGVMCTDACTHTQTYTNTMHPYYHFCACKCCENAHVFLSWGCSSYLLIKTKK